MPPGATGAANFPERTAEMNNTSSKTGLVASIARALSDINLASTRMVDRNMGAINQSTTHRNDR